LDLRGYNHHHHHHHHHYRRLLRTLLNDEDSPSYHPGSGGHNSNVGPHHKNNNDNNNICHHNNNNNNNTTDDTTTVSSIPQRVFDTARWTLDQLHRQQQQQDKSVSSPSLERYTSSTTTTTILECPMITTVTESLNNNTTNTAAQHVYGYHPRGGHISTRYNMYREGFVFSDQYVTYDVLQTQQPEILSTTNTTTTTNTATVVTTSFKDDCLQMFTLLHTIADMVLSNIGQHLQLPHRHPAPCNNNNNKEEEEEANGEENPNDYIQTHYGPTLHHSQWHLKRYTYHPHMECHPTPPPTTTIKEGIDPPLPDPIVLLPSHTDPSIISIVILDQPHIQNGAMGLQYWRQKCHNTSSSSSPKGEWVEVPYSGHDVAIVFVGSILQYITNGYFRAVKHRVVYRDESNTTNHNESEQKTPRPPPHRMAATLFCRPHPSAVLSMVPSPLLLLLPVPTKDPNTKLPSSITFEEWMSKTSKNYQNAKR
jgi:isopenicillin N synthase-like dioxygenase